MADACPNDNSTEAIACLLRAISVNTVPSFSWDPLSFAFTAAIGALALVVAVITVFQGLLAAGPGRLKASANAIGPFAMHSRSRFDKTEIALRTEARVPLITWDVLYHRIVRQKFRPNPGGIPGKRGTDWDDDENSSWFWSRLFGVKRWHQSGLKAAATGSPSLPPTTDSPDVYRPQRRNPHDTTATWISLLSALGLDDPQEFPLIKRLTDYLPADVQAAPAAAELRCLAILAVLADTRANIERSNENRFLKVVGDHSQLTFREHPSMGLVAAYEAYEETAILQVGKGQPPIQFGARGLRVVEFEDLDRGLQLASGRLAYANARLTPSLDGQADQRAFMTLVGDLSRRATGKVAATIGTGSLSRSSTALQGGGQNTKGAQLAEKSCGHDICENAVEDWAGSIESTRMRKKHFRMITLSSFYVAISLLVAERSNMCRAFPKEKLQLSQAVDDLLEFSDFWSEELTTFKMVELRELMYGTFWTEKSSNFQRICSATWVVGFDEGPSTLRNAFNLGSGRKFHLFKFDYVMNILQNIRTWLQRRHETASEQADADSEEGSAFSALPCVLAALDQWLLQHGGQIASCIVLRWLYTLGTEKHLLEHPRRDKVRRGSLVERPPLEAFPIDEMILDSTKLKSGIIQEKRSQPIEVTPQQVETLLIMRAVLVAMLLDGGADTSVLYSASFKDSIVKVL